MKEYSTQSSNSRILRIRNSVYSLFFGGSWRKDRWKSLSGYHSIVDLQDHFVTVAEKHLVEAYSCYYCSMYSITRRVAEEGLTPAGTKQKRAAWPRSLANPTSYSGVATLVANSNREKARHWSLLKKVHAWSFRSLFECRQRQRGDVLEGFMMRASKEYRACCELLS